MDETKTELMPGNFGKDCIENGEHFDEKGERLECLCDECDYMICFLVMEGYDDCDECEAVCCPIKRKK